MKTAEIRTWIFNPFVYIAGFKALILGLVAMLITAPIAFYGRVHFDGAIDLHVGAKTAYWLYLAEPLLAWIIVAITFYLTGIILSKSKIRFIDFIGTTALARVAMLPGAIISLLPPIQHLSPENMTPAMVLASILLLVPMIWLIALLYNAFIISANIKGGKAIIGFITALVLAEVISKMALHYIFTTFTK